MNNTVRWYEIATTDIERAKDFYAEVFNSEFAVCINDIQISAIK